MPEVVINGCYGGFSLSHKAVMALAERKGIKLYPSIDDLSLKHFGPLTPETADDYRGVIHYYKVPEEQYQALYAECKAEGTYKRLNEQDWYFSDRDTPRDDPDLVAVVRELGDQANGNHAALRIAEVPDDAEWEIDEYDGIEHVAEVHRTWS